MRKTKKRMAQVAGTLAVLMTGTNSSIVAKAQESSVTPGVTNSTSASQPWWKNAVIYEIYPRSFQDSNGDGIGDLNGITSRLDYLKSLGINAIWLTPIYPSPQVDFGYDISNYNDIDPQYGTLADFDRLVAEARKRNIGIIMDLVLNHTSDKHPWFVASSSSKDNPKHDWYMWQGGRTAPDGKLEPPNNWESLFGHSAWQYDPKIGQYYYHKFYIQQPDLNWNNPQVRKAMYNVERFWIQHGVAGFRLDAITTLFEDPNLTNEKPVLGKDGKPVINAYGDVQLDDSKTNNLPQVHDVLRELRQVADSYHKHVVLIGETYLHSISDLRKMYGANNDELQLPMDMQVGFINKLDVAEFRTHINEAETGLGGDEPLFVFDNHDNHRWDRYVTAANAPAYHDNIARLLAAILFASRDSAMMYYGDEIGMVTTEPTRKEDVKDPIGITGWPKEKGRDGERTPMQWDAGPNADFAKPGVKTWLPIPASYKTVNVAAESKEPNSLLDWYKQLIALRTSNAALRDGNEVMLNTSDNHVLSWLRRTPGQPAVIVACNFTAQLQTVSFDLTAQGVNGSHLKTLMSSPAAQAQSLRHVQLGPYGVYIGEVQ